MSTPTPAATISIAIANIADVNMDDKLINYEEEPTEEVGAKFDELVVVESKAEESVSAPQKVVASEAGCKFCGLAVHVTLCPWMKA